MSKKEKHNDGSIIIETSIVLPLFMFMFLFIYGLFGVVRTQNIVTHSLFQSSKSLSLDPYLTEHVTSMSEADTFWSSCGDIILDEFVRLNNSKYFSSKTNWYDSSATAYYNNSSSNELAKNRFIGYFSGGDEKVADEKLKALGVVNGLDGIKVEMKVSGDDMTIKLNYEIQIWFDMFDLGKIPIEQEVTARLWK